MSAERCCWLVAAVGESCLARKNQDCKMPLVFRWCCFWGTLVSQENERRTLLLVGSCWWGIPVGQEKKLGCGMPLAARWCCCWGILWTTMVVGPLGSGWGSSLIEISWVPMSTEWDFSLTTMAGVHVDLVGEAGWLNWHGVPPVPGRGFWFAEKRLGFVCCLSGESR